MLQQRQGSNTEGYEHAAGGCALRLKHTDCGNPPARSQPRSVAPGSDPPQSSRLVGAIRSRRPGGPRLRGRAGGRGGRAGADGAGRLCRGKAPACRAQSRGPAWSGAAPAWGLSGLRRCCPLNVGLSVSPFLSQQWDGRESSPEWESMPHLGDAARRPRNSGNTTCTASASPCPAGSLSQPGSGRRGTGLSVFPIISRL